MGVRNPKKYDEIYEQPLAKYVFLSDPLMSTCIYLYIFSLDCLDLSQH